MFLAYLAVSSGITAVGGVGGLGFWVYKIVANEKTFSWSALAAISIGILLMGTLSYIFFRIYNEEQGE